MRYPEFIKVPWNLRRKVTNGTCTRNVLTPEIMAWLDSNVGKLDVDYGIYQTNPKGKQPVLMAVMFPRPEEQRDEMMLFKLTWGGECQGAPDICTEVEIPYTNEKVFEPKAAWNFKTTQPEFTQWIKDHGLWSSGMWWDNTFRSTDKVQVFMFEDSRIATLFKLVWGGK